MRPAIPAWSVCQVAIVLRISAPIFVASDSLLPPNTFDEPPMPQKCRLMLNSGMNVSTPAAISAVEAAMRKSRAPGRWVLSSVSSVGVRYSAPLPVAPDWFDGELEPVRCSDG